MPKLLRHKPIIAVAVLGALCCVAAACTIVDSLQLPVAAQEDSGSTDAGTIPPKDAFDPCRGTGLPDPPATPVGAGPGGNTYFFAVDTVGFSVANDAGGGVGLNLDKQCTCPDPQSCVPLTAANTNCDTLGRGIDNSVSFLVNGQAKTYGYDVEGLSQRALANGRNGMLIRIDQYNDGPNDSYVLFAFYVSGGPAQADGGGVGNTKPTFTTGDLWTVDRAGLLLPDSPGNYDPLISVQAAVTDGVFVAPNLSGVLRLDTSLALVLTSMTISGRLVKDEDAGGKYRIEDGVMAGRWATTDALQNLGNLGDPTSDSGRVCENPITYGALKGLVCRGADVTANGQDNNNSPCNALSIGLRFTAKAATFGAKVNVTTGAGTTCTADNHCTM